MKNENYRKKFEEKEKKLKEEIQYYKRRSFYILLINVVIVVFVFLLFNTVKKNNSNFIDGYQLVIRTKSEYYSDEEINVKVFLINTRNSERSFTINKFKFEVLNENNSVYDFFYDSPVSSKINKLGSILIFDLNHEISISNLKAGTYTINVEMYLDGKYTKKSVSFTVKEEIKKDIIVEPYYTPGEEIIPQLVITNRTASSITLNVKNIQWSLNNQKYLENISESYKLLPGERIYLEASNDFKLNTVGIFDIKCTIFVNDSIHTITKKLNIINFPEKNLKDLNLKIYSNDNLVSRKNVKFKFDILNTIDKDRYLFIDKVIVIIPEINYSYEANNIKIAIPKYGDIELLELPIIFPKSGKYNIIFRLISENNISKVLTLDVP